MKYFSPSYWFKLWVLSAPLFNDKTQGINAKSIDNKKIKDWASNNSSLESINQEISYTNSSTNYQPYSLSQTNQNIEPFYQTELEVSTHKHRHEKSRNRIKKEIKKTNVLNIKYSNDHNSNDFSRNIKLIVNYLLDNNILINVSHTGSGELYAINPQTNNRIFIIPIEIQYYEGNEELKLVFSSNNLYLNGFILRNINTEEQHYYYFSGNDIVRTIENISERNSHSLGFGENYHELTGSDNISWSSIVRSFDYLINRTWVNNNNTPVKNTVELRSNMRNIILATAESIRFNTVRTRINELFLNTGQSNRNAREDWSYFRNIITNWSGYSEYYTNLGSIRFITNTRNNWEEPINVIDINSATSSVVCAFVSHTSGRKKRETTKCEINYNFYEKDCFFERVSNFLSSSNSIKLKLTYTMWENIEKFKKLSSNLEFRNILTSIINNFPQNNSSTARNEDDKNAMVEIIIEHYDDIKNKFNFRKNYPNSKWLVIQGGTDKWFGGAVFHDANNYKVNHVKDELRRKKRNIESNENKWTDDFTKSVNHEQHLAIKNITNSINNITTIL